jgi:hypothetical protein
MLYERAVDSLQGLALKLDALQTAALLICLYITSQVLLVCYRLTFHPLARFPGPRLAGASYWYEYYYDVSKKGKFIWKIMELHQQYGLYRSSKPSGRKFTRHQGRLFESTQTSSISTTQISTMRYIMARST